MNRLLISVVILGLVSITCSSTATPVVVEREGEPDVIMVESDDPEMNAAIQEAQDSLDVFIADLESPRVGQVYFSIKARFPVPGSSGDYEHIWLYDVVYTGDKFTGRIANEPLDVPDLELDQKVSVEREDVSDWMIIEDGVLVGGFTIRVLRDRLSPEEREEFDRGLGFVILDE